MTSLEQVQREFASNLIVDAESTRGCSMIVGKLPIEGLLDVYRNNSRASLEAALAAEFPVIRKLVGAEFFRYMTGRYTLQYPLHSGDLCDLGRYMSNFLGHFGPVSTLPYIVDVARLERAYQLVSRAASLQQSSTSLLRLCASGRLGAQRFSLAGACRQISSDYPIFSIWRANQDDYPDDGQVDLGEGPQSVLVLRSKKGVELWRLEKADATFVGALTSGETLESAVNSMAARGYSIHLEKLLVEYVQRGCLVISGDDEDPWPD